MEFKPHDYQQYAIEYIETHEVAAILLDMGLGKTAITLTALSDLLFDYFEITRVLVIAPLRVARNTWPQEIEKWDHLKDIRCSVAVGSEKERLEAFRRDADIYIINRENVQWMVENVPFEFDAIVVDELSSFKNWNSKRFKSLMKVRPRAKRVIGLTGTPSGNGLMDLFAEFKVLDMGQRLGRFITKYRQDYFRPDRMNGQVVYSYKPLPGAEKRIYDKISDITISMKAADHLKMPELVNSEYRVYMEEPEQAIYDEMCEDLAAQLDKGEVTAANAGVLSGKLCQMANGAVYTDNGDVEHIHDQKLDALEDIIESMNGKPLLVAYWYQHDLDRIEERLRLRKIGFARLDSDASIAKWNRGEIPVALIHPASAGHGLNLQSGGATLCWFGITWSLELYQQTVARLYRQGQASKTVVVQHIITDGTIDERIMKRYGRVLYLKDYASYISDEMVSEFADINQNMMISIDIIPIPTDEAVNEAQNRLLGVETNITNWQRRQNANQNFSATVPYDMELQKEESREFLRDLTTRDQRMMVAVVTFMHTAESKKQLDADTHTILSLARNRMCQMAVLKFQQMDGMNTALPIGVRKIDSMRTLTTESLGSLIPFRTQEVMDKGGIYCGINAISHNLILVNRGLLLNPSAFILGVPGSGKSMLTKMFILLIILSTSKDQVLVYDPEGEYEPLVQALGGVSLPICAGSDIHLNAMDMVKGYGDKNPVVDKSQFVLSLYERITDDRYIIGPKEKSILDRCVERVYSRKRQYEIPTFFTLRRVLQEQDEPEAKDLALMLELFTDGTLNNFSHPTNIETENRLISFNTRGMVEDMKDLGQLVITDHMINRVSQNWENGVRTHIFLDEFHTLLQHKYSANFFDSAYRRFRKRNAWTTSLTQNVEYVLDSLTARTMLSNSEFIVMLNQSASDREQLAELLHISGEQMKYITNARAGNGLARIGSALVPFYNQMSKNSEIYKLMSTKPEDFEKTWGSPGENLPES